MRFSLRGKLTANDNAVTGNHLVFDYVSPDRTRAWKVIEAYFWPVSWHNITLGDDGFMCAAAALATDTYKVNWNELCDPTENRTFAWGMQTYNTRDASTDFITPNGVPLGRMNMLIDPDHLITQQLFINIGTNCDVDVSQEREWGWLVVIEEKKVTPTQSVFQQIKGIAQDIDS